MALLGTYKEQIKRENENYDETNMFILITLCTKDKAAWSMIMVCSIERKKKPMVGASEDCKVGNGKHGPKIVSYVRFVRKYKKNFLRLEEFGLILMSFASGTRLGMR